jgi:signal transduction histidine kinase
LRFVLLLLTALVLLAGAPASARASTPLKSILVFTPDDPTVPAMAAITGGVKTTVQTGWDGPVTFGFESLGVAWFQSPAYEAQLRGLFRIKYQGYRPDVIVTLRLDVLRILLDIRGELWPGVPIVFMAEDERALAKVPSAPNLTGVWIHFEVRKTVENALQLFPGTRRVAVVMGASPWERSLYPAVDEELAPLAGRVELIDLKGLPFAELERRLAALPGDAIIFFHTFYVDGEGKRFVSMQIIDRIHASIQRPLFTVHGLAVGHGAVGGSVIDYDRLGKDLGSIALRALRGDPLSEIPPREADASDLELDARELAHFHVPERWIPPGAAIQFREPSLWDRYRFQAIGAVAGISLEGALIAVLLVERRRRARAQAMTTAVLASMAHLNRVSSMGDLASSLAHEINQPLAAILSTAQAARRMLGSDGLGHAEAGEALQDIIAADKRAGEVIRRMRAMLKKGAVQCELADLNDIVREAAQLVGNDAIQRGASLTLALSEAPLPVRGDAVQLEQVALNLMSNAFDAVADQPASARIVTVRTASVEGQMELVVEDTGRGITEGEVEQIFEPFFTTKPQGLGMGLAISRAIIQAHGGRLQAERRPGGGTMIRCAIPAAVGGETR